MPELPTVSGLTESLQAQEASGVTRLADFLMQQRGSDAALEDALSSLEAAFKREANPQMKARIAAARSLLLGETNPMSESRDDAMTAL